MRSRPEDRSEAGTAGRTEVPRGFGPGGPATLAGSRGGGRGGGGADPRGAEIAGAEQAVVEHAWCLLLRANALAARRVEALTGNAAPEPAKAGQQTKLPANGGEIGKARQELQAARLRGLRATGIYRNKMTEDILAGADLAVYVGKRARKGRALDVRPKQPLLSPVLG